MRHPWGGGGGEGFFKVKLVGGGGGGGVPHYFEAQRAFFLVWGGGPRKSLQFSFLVPVGHRTDTDIQSGCFNTTSSFYSYFVI